MVEKDSVLYNTELNPLLKLFVWHFEVSTLTYVKKFIYFLKS